MGISTDWVSRLTVAFPPPRSILRAHDPDLALLLPAGAAALHTSKADEARKHAPDLAGEAVPHIGGRCGNRPVVRNSPEPRRRRHCDTSGYQGACTARCTRIWLPIPKQKYAPYSTVSGWSSSLPISTSTGCNARCARQRRAGAPADLHVQASIDCSISGPGSIRRNRRWATFQEEQGRSPPKMEKTRKEL